MPSREMSVAVGETFHPEICLVGMEPVSNFIILEDYQPQRDGDTWNRCLGAKLAPLPITVCQIVSDQAKAIIHYAEVHLSAHHSPDLFQRSSSCVEGRNGQLSLKHHALHRFTLRKLQAVSVLHNYLARRPDGTTAAERFYGTVPGDLLGWLLDRLSIPARPRAHRLVA